MGAKHSARNPAKYLASCPRNFPAMTGQRQQQCRRTSVKTTRKTARLAPDLAAQQPQNISQDDSSESRRHVFNHPALKL
jgi:hypothetical protein